MVNDIIIHPVIYSSYDNNVVTQNFEASLIQQQNAMSHLSKRLRTQSSRQEGVLNDN